MMDLIGHIGMPGVPYLLGIWKHQDNTDSVVVKHLDIELILAVRVELLILYIISLIKMKIILGLC
jgi:mannosyltransferase OCH1-like enzyme